MIKEYLDFYRMEYTLSVYVPEAALSNQESLSREELQRIMTCWIITRRIYR
jgi:hypothetical protein